MQMNDENENISLDYFVIEWAGEIGWGQLTLHYNYEKDKWLVDSECMGLEFAKTILCFIIYIINENTNFNNDKSQFCCELDKSFVNVSEFYISWEYELENAKKIAFFYNPETKKLQLDTKGLEKEFVVRKIAITLNEIMDNMELRE